MSESNFKKKIWKFYEKEGRHGLPWRNTKNPYRILVSEVMLQQTQVDRVIPYYESFLKLFPTPGTLAEAKLGDVLRAWQGLGYNRRAKYLQQSAKEIVARYKKFPKDEQALRQLSGIGPYTARAICVFAFNEPKLLIETNIRTVFIHEFFPNKKGVSDEQLMRHIASTLDTERPREWYWALMDYGSYVKKNHPNPNRRSVHHTTQPTFRGSRREVRGLILKHLGQRDLSPTALAKLTGKKINEIRSVLGDLSTEGLVQKTGNHYHL